MLSPKIRPWGQDRRQVNRRRRRRVTPLAVVGFIVLLFLLPEDQRLRVALFIFNLLT